MLKLAPPIPHICAPTPPCQVSAPQPSYSAVCAPKRECSLVSTGGSRFSLGLINRLDHNILLVLLFLTIVGISIGDRSTGSITNDPKSPIRENNRDSRQISVWIDHPARSGLRACYTTRSLTGGIGGFNGTHTGAFLNKH